MSHRDTSVAIKQAINQALNATQGHKQSCQTSYYSGSKCHTGTQALVIYQAFNQSLQSLPYTGLRSQPAFFNGGTFTLHDNHLRCAYL